MAKQDIWTRIQTIDPRFIYLAMGIVATFFVIYTVVLPIPVTKNTKMLYDFIENLPPGSVIVMSEEHTVGYWPQLGPGAVAVWQHAFNRPLKLIFITFSADGAMLEHQALKTLLNTGNKEYGVDWVEIGYVAGEETGVAAFSKDFTMPRVDYYGAPLDTLSLLKEVRTANDISLWVTIGSSGVYYVLRQINAPYGVPMATVTMSGLEATFLPFLESKQMVGLINSVIGGAEYEILIGRPGYGNQQIGALTMTTLAIFILVFFGNITYWVGRWKKK